MAWRCATAGQTFNNTSSWVLTKPTSPAAVQEGDILLAWFTTAGAGTTVSTPPTDWTALPWVPLEDPTATSTSFAYWKLATASEPADYTWTLSALQSGTGGVSAYSGRDTAAPIDTSNGQATAAGTDHTTPTINVTNANCDLVGLWAADETVVATWTAPGTATERFDVQDGPTDVASTLSDEIFASTGNVSRTAMLSTSNTAVAALVALKPAAGAGPAPPAGKGLPLLGVGR